MHLHAQDLPASAPSLRLIAGGGARYEPDVRRSLLRAIVGGCPDHWCKPTARRTAACTCD